jgi:hypothetical protein
MGFVWFSEKTVILSMHRVNQLIFVMEKGAVFFGVGTKILNIIWMSFALWRVNSCRYERGDYKITYFHQQQILRMKLPDQFHFRSTGFFWNYESVSKFIGLFGRTVSPSQNTEKREQPSSSGIRIHDPNVGLVKTHVLHRATTLIAIITVIIIIDSEWSISFFKF